MLAPPPLLPISATLNRCRKAYYDALRTASLTNDLTEWIHTFTSLLIQSQNELESDMLFLVEKIRYFCAVCTINEPAAGEGARPHGARRA